MSIPDREQASDWLETVIQNFIARSPENNLGNGTGEKAFAGVIVGFSRGSDPLYEEYKEVVGPYHWTAREAFTLTFPERRVDADELTVISWILPQTRATKSDNRKERFYPSERWARARIFGEEVNVKLRRHVLEALRDRGYDAVAPQLSPEWERKQSDRYVLASTWSERHAAYASGLGTFGLCDGLITSKGKAMRTGSVIANIQIPPTPRPYNAHKEYCLFFSHGTCGKCISRCPVGAITEVGHDKVKCNNHLRPTTKDYVTTRFGFEGWGCGLCQTGVPCESRIPRQMDLEATDQV